MPHLKTVPATPSRDSKDPYPSLRRLAAEPGLLKACEAHITINTARLTATLHQSVRMAHIASFGPDKEAAVQYLVDAADSLTADMAHLERSATLALRALEAIGPGDPPGGISFIETGSVPDLEG